MPFSEKFEKFSNAIIKEATMEKEIFMLGLEREISEFISEKQSKILKEMNINTEEYKNEQESKKIVEILKRKNSLKKEWIAERTKMFELLIENLIKKIKNFLLTAEYDSYLEYHLKNSDLIIKEENINEIEILVRSKDVEKIKNKVEKMWPGKVSINTKDIIGGFIIISKDVKIDASFDDEIEKQKKVFYTSGVLISEK